MGLVRNRGFVLLWVGQFLGVLADWALRTILLIWVFKLTRSGVAVSIVGLAEALPLLLLAPIAGVFVDRWNRAYTMAGAVLARAVVALPLLAVTNRADMPLIVAVTLLANGASQFFLPAANASVPAIVGQERAGQANSLLSLSNGGIAVLGPGPSALLFASVGPRGAVTMLILLYVLAAPLLLSLLTIRATPAPRTPPVAAPSPAPAEALV